MSATTLGGARLLITRGADKRSTLIDALRAAGADVVHVPLIATEILIAAGEVRRAVDALEQGPGGSWMVFTSATAVRIVVEAGAVVPSGSRVAAVGPATADALREAGWRVDLVPEIATADGLAAALAGAVGTGHALLFAAAGGRDAVVPALRAAGATVATLVLYRSTMPAGAAADLLRALDPAPAAVLFFSGSAVRHAAEALADAQPPPVLTVCIGPTTAAAAREAGWHDVVSPAGTSNTQVLDLLTARLGRGHPVP